MKNDADRQLAEITVKQVKELLREKIPVQFDQMIINDDQVLCRTNYTYVNVHTQTVRRYVEQLEVPLFDNIALKFAKFEGGVEKFGDKSYLPSEAIFATTTKFKIIHSFPPPPQAFVFPLQVKGEELDASQPLYFFPKYTYQETCKECQGEKYVTCKEDDCNGKHNWVCPTCAGQRRVVCHPCGGVGRAPCSKCDGAKTVTCNECRGKGGKYISGGNYANGTRKPDVWQQCSGCRGKGEITCDKCHGQGTTICKSCQGEGKVTCSHCDGRGDITCTICYGDKAKYGLVDCPTCCTASKIGHLVYCATTIKHSYQEYLLANGVMRTSVSKKYKPGKIEYMLAYKNINEMVVENYDKYCKLYLSTIQKAKGVGDKFPRVVQEEVCYKITPCIKVTCKHLLTKQEYSVSIFDFWDNPEITVKEPEVDNSIGENLVNSTKTVGSFFAKLFKTKGFKVKEDRKRAIKLMIYVSKADGMIAEQEKQMLIEQINDFNEFTNPEKRAFLDFLNQSNISPLVSDDYDFESKTFANEIKDVLTQLASVDGIIHPAEMAIIERISMRQPSSTEMVNIEIPEDIPVEKIDENTTALTSPKPETLSYDTSDYFIESIKQLKNIIMKTKDKQTVIDAIVLSPDNIETVFALQSHIEDIRIAVINKYFRQSMLGIAEEFNLLFTCSDNFELGRKGDYFEFHSTQWSKCNIKFIFDKTNFQHMYWCIYAEQALSNGKQMKLDIFSDDPAATYPYGWSWFEYKDWAPNTYIDIVNGTFANLVKEKVQITLNCIETIPEIKL